MAVTHCEKPVRVRFPSVTPDLDGCLMVAVAQLARAEDCGSSGYGFEPRRLPQIGDSSNGFKKVG